KDLPRHRRSASAVGDIELNRPNLFRVTMRIGAMVRRGDKPALRRKLRHQALAQTAACSCDERHTHYSSGRMLLRPGRTHSRFEAFRDKGTAALLWKLLSGSKFLRGSEIEKR